MRTFTASALLTMALSGCGDSNEAAEPETTTTVTASVPNTPAPSTSDPSAEALASFGCTMETSPGLLVLSWEIVTASRRAHDQKQWVDKFIEEVAERQDDLKDEGCPGMVELAGLGAEVGLLNIMVTAKGQGTDAHYQSVADKGNQWLGKVGHTGVTFQGS